MKPAQPNGARTVSIVEDRIHPQLAWRYVIDLDDSLWVQCLFPGKADPWELLIEARPLRRTAPTRPSGKRTSRNR